ncbi:MAG: hypothetical protein QME12_09315 [Nanoarchaeota archaeon]|nr:hypothetical protein [Nanoarchaeota archaeon]
MLKVIFDTNIYGRLIEEPKSSEIISKIRIDNEFKVYGFHPIRKELRDMPKSSKLGKIGKRNLLLSVYDTLTAGKYLHDSIQINKPALKFYNSYRQFGGIRN